MSEAFNYSSYLQIPALLRLQQMSSSPPEHDEMLFIVIHQVYELWFKQMLHELDHLYVVLRGDDLMRALHTLKRLLTILKTAVSQVDILETMTPTEFNSFRDYLQSASGFQSVQFREIEFLLGHKHDNMLKHFSEDIFHYDALQRRYQAPTIWDAFLRYLDANGFQLPIAEMERDVTQAVTASAAVQAILLEIYRTRHPAEQICERLVDFDEGIQEWRYRHMQMVQRTIGVKPGTGGSPGAKYLRTTIQPLFPDLWAIRSAL